MVTQRPMVWEAWASLPPTPFRFSLRSTWQPKSSSLPAEIMLGDADPIKPCFLCPPRQLPGVEVATIGAEPGMGVQIDNHPLCYTEMWNSHMPSWGNVFSISVFIWFPVFSAAISKLARQNPLHGSPFTPASASAFWIEQEET